MRAERRAWSSSLSLLSLPAAGSSATSPARWTAGRSRSSAIVSSSCAMRLAWSVTCTHDGDTASQLHLPA